MQRFCSIFSQLLQLFPRMQLRFRQWGGASADKLARSQYLRLIPTPISRRGQF